MWVSSWKCFRSFSKDRNIVGAAPDITRPQFQEKAADRSASRVLCKSTGFLPLAKLVFPT